MLILSSLYRWVFGDSAFVLGHAIEKEKNKSVKLVSRDGKLFWKFYFQPHLWKSLTFRNWYSSHQFSKYLGHEITFFEVTEKVHKKLRKSLNWQNEDKNIFCTFFKCSLNFRAHALQSELNKGLNKSKISLLYNEIPQVPRPIKLEVFWPSQTPYQADLSTLFR